MKKFILPAAIAAISLLPSCSDTTDSIGSDLFDNETEVVIESDFKVTGHTTASNVAIQSRTTAQLLGSIDAKGYGKFTSDFVTQFMPSTSIDTEGVLPEYIDSLKLHLLMPKGTGCIGDSILPMGLNVYRLDKQLPSPIFSNFDATGYYSPSGLLASKIYAFNTLERSDSVQNLSYRSIEVQLPLSLARELFNLYRENPAAYSTPMEFAKYFPGIAVTNTFGSGRVVEITSSTMRMYYHKMEADTAGVLQPVKYVGTYFAVTPEVVSNNCIDYAMSPQLKARIDAGENILVAPAGRDIELDFPARQVIDYYRKNSGTLSVINTLTFKIPAAPIENDYKLGAPQQVLLVLSKDKDEFFSRNKTPDSKTSFYAEYNSSTGGYTFSSMRDYILNLIDKYGTAGEIPEEEFRFTLVPVTVETESVNNYYSSAVYVTSVQPYVQRPVMCTVDLSSAKVTLTFSKQTIK